MLFLVDYENVGCNGMRGSEYLNEQDRVIIFYSDARKNIERRYLEAITDSGCTFEICKLCKTGKNALDFYIATRLGELMGEGYRGITVIVSNDGGFQAVRDYWEKRAEQKRRVFVSSSIEIGIASSNENNARTKELKKQRQTLTIGSYYAAYAEKKRIREVLEQLFAGTEYEAMVSEIQNLIGGKEKAARVIYLNSLHLFGRKNGLAIYNKLKTCEEL